jgi:hypothetical protein
MSDNASKLKIRIFGANECMYCKKLCEEMSMIGVPYDFVDANSSETQQLCDQYNVDKLPHTQCYDNINGNIVFEHAGTIGAQDFMNKLAEKISGKKGATFTGKPRCNNCKKK